MFFTFKWYKAANESEKVVAFLSAEYAKSEACMREWKVGYAKRKLLVVLVGSIDDIMAIDVNKHPAASAALAFIESGGQMVMDPSVAVREILRGCTSSEEPGGSCAPSPLLKEPRLCTVPAAVPPRDFRA